MIKCLKVFLAILAIAIFAVGFLYSNGAIGLPKSRLEADARVSQKIEESWFCEKDSSDEIAAYIFYPQDRSDHTFSIYVNRPGVSFGYFFRGGGTLLNTPNDINEFTIEGIAGRVFISMNRMKAERIEVDDGNGIRTMEVDSGRPFVIVLPDQRGIVTFYDRDGAVIEIVRQKL